MKSYIVVYIQTVKGYDGLRYYILHTNSYERKYRRVSCLRIPAGLKVGDRVSVDQLNSWGTDSYVYGLIQLISGSNVNYIKDRTKLEEKIRVFDNFVKAIGKVESSKVTLTIQEAPGGVVLFIKEQQFSRHRLFKESLVGCYSFLLENETFCVEGYKGAKLPDLEDIGCIIHMVCCEAVKYMEVSEIEIIYVHFEFVCAMLKC